MDTVENLAIVHLLAHYKSIAAGFGTY